MTKMDPNNPDPDVNTLETRLTYWNILCFNLILVEWFVRRYCSRSIFCQLNSKSLWSLQMYWRFYRIFIILIHNTGFILKMTDKIMCLVSTSRELRWKERTSGRRDFKPFFSVLPLGTRSELLGRRLFEGLTNEILFRT